MVASSPLHNARLLRSLAPLQGLSSKHDRAEQSTKPSGLWQGTRDRPCRWNSRPSAPAIRNSELREHCNANQRARTRIAAAREGCCLDRLADWLALLSAEAHSPHQPCLGAVVRESGPAGEMSHWPRSRAPSWTRAKRAPSATAVLAFIIRPVAAPSSTTTTGGRAYPSAPRDPPSHPDPPPSEATPSSATCSAGLFELPRQAVRKGR